MNLFSAFTPLIMMARVISTNITRFATKFLLGRLHTTAFPIVHHFRHVRHFPKLVTDAGCHRGRDAERLVDTAEIVVHEIDRQRVTVVFHFLGKCIGEPREPAKAHADIQVHALGVRRADLGHIRLADDRLALRADAR